MESIFENGLHPIWGQRVNFQHSWIFNIMIVKVQDINPKEVISWTIHSFKVAVVVCERECLFTYHTVNWTKLRIVVRIGFLLAVLV